jgi:Amt family ammonium transporter
LLTGIFNSPDFGGPGLYADWASMTPGYPGMLAQLWIQAKAVGVCILWSAVVAFVAYKIADVLVGLRVSEEEEREGLDINSHGETAYHM